MFFDHGVYRRYKRESKRQERKKERKKTASRKNIANSKIFNSITKTSVLGDFAVDALQQLQHLIFPVAGSSVKMAKPTTVRRDNINSHPIHIQALHFMLYILLNMLTIQSTISP